LTACFAVQDCDAREQYQEAALSTRSTAESRIIRSVEFPVSTIMRHNITLCIIVVLALLLQGCGKKGPLTLPQDYASGAQSSLSGR
jgi:hypothetical protein